MRSRTTVMRGRDEARAQCSPDCRLVSNCPPSPCDHSALTSLLTMTSHLLQLSLAVWLTLSHGLWLARTGEPRLGTRLEVRPLNIQTEAGLLGEPLSVSGILGSLHQAVTSFIDSVIYLVSSQFREGLVYDFSSSIRVF